MIDELGIFKKIEEVILKEYPGTYVCPFGSRVKGKSRSGKWDFDVVVFGAPRTEAIKMNALLEEKFKGVYDENSRLVKIDLFVTKFTDFEEFKDNMNKHYGICI